MYKNIFLTFTPHDILKVFPRSLPLNKLLNFNIIFKTTAARKVSSALPAWLDEGHVPLGSIKVECDMSAP